MFPIGLAIALLVPLSACTANLGQSLQQALSADPNASRWSQGGQATQLPEDFPTELRYPNAQLQAVTSNQSEPTASPAQAEAQEPLLRETRWSTPDALQQVQAFYQQQLQQGGWQIVDQSADNGLILSARRQDLQVTVVIPNPADSPPQDPNRGTEFVLAYAREAPVAAATPQPSPEATASPSNQQAPAGSPQDFTDLDQAPQELQPYLQDLAQLGIFPEESSTFNPNQPMSRRDFARWLVEVNNRIYQDQPGRQIRVASDSATAAFQDLESTDPGFAAVQGLAEAGYIPSPLSGDSNATRFRPGAALTREELLTWKVPIDLRRILPTASVDSIRQTWGFKDANRISANALAAVAADHQNGDLSNIRRVFGSTLLLQPTKPVTRAEAAAALWYVGVQGEGFSAQDILKGERQNAASSDT
jgi:hypothetical protein